MEDISVSMVVITLWETFGWLFIVGSVVAVLMLLVLLKAFLRRRAQRQPFAGLFWRGVMMTLITAAVVTPFVPLWTMAPIGDLRGAVDVVIAYVIALAPAAIVGVLWVYVGSLTQPKTP